MDENEIMSAKVYAKASGVALNRVRHPGNGFSVDLWRARKDGVTAYRPEAMDAIVACLKLANDQPLMGFFARLSEKLRRIWRGQK